MTSTAASSSTKSCLVSDIGSGYSDDAHLFSMPAATTVRVRLYGDTEVYSLPRSPFYMHMLSSVRRTLRHVLQGVSSSGIVMLNSTDHVVLTKASWPFLVHTLYEIVVRVFKPTGPQARLPNLGDVIDLTGDADDDDGVRSQVRPGGGSRISQAASPTPYADATKDCHDEEGAAATARHAMRSVASAPPVVRMRGASILPHVRKNTNVVRRSMSRSVPSIRQSVRGFPELCEHYKLERAYKRTCHWTVPPIEKHASVHAYLTRNCSEGLDAKDRTWLGRHRLRGESQDERKLVNEGRD